MRPKPGKKQFEYDFRMVTEADLERDRVVERYVAEHLAKFYMQLPWAECFLEENRNHGDKVPGNQAERLKAIITMTGQFDHPGAPMSVIIGRTGIPPAQFEASPVSAELAEFLTRIPWNEV